MEVGGRTGVLGGSGPAACDFSIAFLFAVSLLPVRYLFDSIFFKPLSGLLLHPSAAKKMTLGVRLSKIAKCSESMWKFTYYVTMQLWVISIMQKEPWLLKTNEYFNGWPNQELTQSLKLFYMCQGGFYAYSIVSLLAWETPRKDSAVMMFHHIITSILIAVSYLSCFFRIGTIILALHDTSDVFVELAKICKYSEKELAASISFGVFAITWLLERLIFFPFWIIRAVSMEILEPLKKYSSHPYTLYSVFNSMLLMLLACHIYWWKLICKMIFRQLHNKGKVGEDIRSDSEGDD